LRWWVRVWVADLVQVQAAGLLVKIGVWHCHRLTDM
jgi:hypothetical protein